MSGGFAGKRGRAMQGVTLEGRKMRHRILIAVGLLALGGPPLRAVAQTPAGQIVVPLGATAMVDNPCPPQPPVPIARFGEPGRPAVYAEPPVLAAYQAYGVWRAANDWADLCHYRAENRALAGAGTRPRVVFMGDSITELWKAYDPGFFTGGIVDRGISGQTTPQMVVRFYADVVALHPRAVHIMAGTNDVAGNTGPTSDDQFKANITAMVDLAKANGIQVVLASIPPTRRFSWRPDLRPAAKVRELNAWLKGFAATRGAAYVDYYAVLADADGGFRAELTSDGVHPATAGYGLMKIEAERALARP
jgi:lysophospholipase L1-like esterase